MPLGVHHGGPRTTVRTLLRPRTASLGRQTFTDIDLKSSCMLCALCFVLLICKAKRSLESIKSHDSFNGPPAPSPEISHPKRGCITKTRRSSSDLALIVKRVSRESRAKTDASPDHYQRVSAGLHGGIRLHESAANFLRYATTRPSTPHVSTFAGLRLLHPS